MSAKESEVVVALPASTVMLLRQVPDGECGLEVLLLRRHHRSPAFAGSFVFPGGKVEIEDAGLDPTRWAAEDLTTRAREIGVADEASALGFLVAAVRETFEEAGILLACREDGRRLSSADLRSRSFVEARRALMVGRADTSWARFLAAEALVLQLDAISLWSWWVTPMGRPHRFDTRFFVAQLPAAQAASPDTRETTELRWEEPTSALAAHRDGEMQFHRPTVANLTSLATHRDPRSVVQAARRGEVDRQRIEPPA